MIAVKNKGVRKFLSIFLPLFLIPLCVAAGAFIFPSGSFAYTIVLVALLSIAAFFGGFEQKKTGSRRLILVAVMVSLSVIGRFIPFFKPISAITVLTAVYFGREAGFLTGSLSAVISDIYFGMGPWTPFQMLSFGLIGFFAGIFGERLKKSTPLLLIYGGLSGIVFPLLWMCGRWRGTAAVLILPFMSPHFTLPFPIRLSTRRQTFFSSPFSQSPSAENSTA